MVCDMKKAFVLLGLVFCISGCSLNENDNDMDSAYESLDNEEKAIGGDVDEVYDLLESSKITIPKYFKNKGSRYLSYRYRFNEKYISVFVSRSTRT